MNTRLVNSAAGVINAALAQCRTAAGIALALESAQLLMSPETAAELEHLRREAESNRVDGRRLIRAEQRAAELEAVLSTHRKDDQATIERLTSRVAELEAERATTNRALVETTLAQRAAEDICHPCGCPKRFDRHAWGCPEVEAEGRTVDEDPIAYALTPAAEASADRLTRVLAPTRDRRGDDDPARCLKVHPFSPRDGWRMVCGSCDHGRGADCHQTGGAS